MNFTSAAAPINRVESTVTYNGNVYTVVAIGEQVFYSHVNMIQEFTIPNTVRVLETFALEDNTRVLRTVVLEDGNEDLFCYRKNLMHIHFFSRAFTNSVHFNNR